MPTEEERIDELEVRYTYLERAVRDLDQVVIDLRAQVDRLERELKRLADLGKDDGEPSPEHEKPPHY